MAALQVPLEGGLRGTHTLAHHGVGAAYLVLFFRLLRSCFNIWRPDLSEKLRISSPGSLAGVAAPWEGLQICSLVPPDIKEGQGDEKSVERRRGRAAAWLLC